MRQQARTRLLPCNSRESGEKHLVVCAGLPHIEIQAFLVSQKDRLVIENYLCPIAFDRGSFAPVLRSVLSLGRLRNKSGALEFVHRVRLCTFDLFACLSFSSFNKQIVALTIQRTNAQCHE